MQIEFYTLNGRGNNLKELMAEKVKSVSPGGCHVTTSMIREEVYHCFGATVTVCKEYLSIFSENVPKAKKGLEATLGHSLVPFIPNTKNQSHSHHHS